MQSPQVSERKLKQLQKDKLIQRKENTMEGEQLRLKLNLIQGHDVDASDE